MFIYQNQMLGRVTQKGTFKVQNDSIYTENIKQHMIPHVVGDKVTIKLRFADKKSAPPSDPEFTKDILMLELSNGARKMWVRISDRGIAKQRITAMKNTILLLLLVLTLPISAQNENSALFRELTDAMCLNQRERLWMIDYMTHWSNSTLTIDGVEYLTSYNPLALVSDSLEHLRLYDGILGEDVEEYVTIRDSWGDRPNTNDSYCCTWALDNKHLILTGIYRQGWKEVDDAERVHINKRMEDFTGCKFVGNRMFLNALSGTLYVKAANTESKPCDIGTNKREMDCPEYVRWVFEPVYRLTFKNGTLVSREELICCDGVDFEQDDLSVEDVVIYQKVDAPPVFLNEMKAIENKEIKDLLDAEALRIVNAMPRWEPARDNKGKKFDSGAELIIDFRLQKNKVPVAVVDESDFGCKYHVTIWQEPRKMKNHGDDILKP